MQIDRYNHLLFPRDANPGNNPATSGKDASPSAAGSAGVRNKPHAVPAPVQARGVVRPDNPALGSQRPDGKQAASRPVDPPLYTPGRRMPAAGDAATENDAMARDHQLAVDRHAGIVTQISLKDGVLVAKPHPLAPDKQSDFVALAVSAMREYSDEHDRQKVRAAPDAAAALVTPAQTPWSTIKGLQQIAAKLNVFA